MGQTQSHVVDAGVQVVPSKGSKRSSINGCILRPGRAGRREKLKIHVVPKDRDASPKRASERSFLLSPSNATFVTDPETPASRATPTDHGAWSRGTPSFKNPRTIQNADAPHAKKLIDFYNSPSLRFGDVSATVIESVITEEESTGSPSDEEDLAVEQRQTAEEVNFSPMRRVSASPIARPYMARPNRSPNSPKHSQYSGRVFGKRITTPESIIHHPPLIAPPKGVTPDAFSVKPKSSVNPHTLADFNKLKVQVELAKRAENYRRHQEKVKDRFEDVQGYRNLWKEFEQIEQKVSDGNGASAQPNGLNQKENVLDLKAPKSWFIDFKRLAKDSKGYDDESPCSLSLFSEASMEAQRRLFAEKQLQRRRKGQSQQANDPSCDGSVVSLQSAPSCRSQPALVRGETDQNDYGPPRQIVPASPDNASCASSEVSTRTIRYCRELAASDNGDTERNLASDCDNDYKVPRRRRRRRRNSLEPTHDDSSLSTFDDRSLESFSSRPDIDFANFIHVCRDIKNAPSSIELRKSKEELWNRYGINASALTSSHLKTVTLPSVAIDDAAHGRVKWRQFPGDNNPAKLRSAPRCLEREYANHEKHESPSVQETLQQEPAESAIAFDKGGQCNGCGTSSQNICKSQSDELTERIDSSPSRLSGKNITKGPDATPKVETLDGDESRNDDEVGSSRSIKKNHGFGDGFGVYDPSISLMSTDDFRFYSPIPRTRTSSRGAHGSRKKNGGLGEGFGVYDPSISFMSTEDFLFYSPGLQTHIPRTVSQVAQDDAFKPESDTVEEASRKNLSERAECDDMNAPHLCSPIIADMTTDNFLLVSSNICISPVDRVDESHSPGLGMEQIRKEASEGIPSALNYGLQTPSEKAHSQFDGAADGNKGSSQLDLGPMVEASPATLVNRARDKAGLLLSKYNSEIYEQGQDANGLSFTAT